MDVRVLLVGIRYIFLLLHDHLRVLWWAADHGSLQFLCAMSEVAIRTIFAIALLVVFAERGSVVSDLHLRIRLRQIVGQRIADGPELALPVSKVASISKRAVAVLEVTAESGLIFIDLHHRLWIHVLRGVHFQSGVYVSAIYINNICIFIYLSNYEYDFEGL